VLAIHEHISIHNPIDTLSGLEWLQNCTLCRLRHSPQPVSVGRKKGYENQALQHITTNSDISYEFDFDFTTSFSVVPSNACIKVLNIMTHVRIYSLYQHGG